MVDPLQSNLAPNQVPWFWPQMKVFCPKAVADVALQGEHFPDWVNGPTSPDGGVEQRQEQADQGGHTERGRDGERGQPGRHPPRG